MKSTKWIIGIGVIILITLSLACTLPAQFAQKTSVSTPDITLTAIVAQLYIQASETAAAPLLKASETPVPSTNTPEPTATVPAATAIPPTPTVTNTETPVPTVSYKGPAKRPGTSVEAIYLYDEPTIDGVLDEWEMDRYYADEVVYGNSQWKGENDSSASYMVGWDEDYLFIAAKIKDDKYVQRSSGKNLFKGDSIEILLDTSVSNDYYLDKLSKDDFQLGISPGSPKPGDDSEAYLWYPEAYADEKHEVKIGTMQVDEGYRIEAKIPWDVFRTEPEKDAHFGFVFSISDNDKSGESIQQSIISSDGNRDLLDPTTWEDLVLTGAPVPDKRPGPGIEAEYLSTAPSIDGNLGDWSLDAVDVSHVTYGDDKWGGDDDLSGDVMVGWDEDYLYLGVNVVDDSYQQRMKGDKLYLGDSLEVLLDRHVEDDYLDHHLNEDDFQLGISAGSPDVNHNPHAYLWNPASKAGAKSKVKIAASTTSDGYVVEVAIPWNALGGSPDEGDHLGFLFSISDNDHPSKNIQQTMISTIDERVWTDPATWGDLVLID